MDDYIHKELDELFSSFTQLPYLFIGTGVSMRYADAPSWDDLLFDIWRKINPEDTRHAYDKMKQGIERTVYEKHGEVSEDEKKYYVNPTIATQLENSFCKLYYDTDDFEKKVFSADENNEIISNRYNPFKYYVSKRFKEVSIKTDKNEYRELISLKKNQNKIAGIITTNYDMLLESIFTEFSVMVGQSNMMLSNTFSIFEIYKIHGCMSEPNSIILTEKDYSGFECKLKYLSAKLLTIFFEHPIIFIGYGMGDVNIRNLFKQMAECLTSEQLEQCKNNFIFISKCESEKELYLPKEIEFGNHMIPMKEFSLKDFSHLYDSLSKIQSSLPIKLARQLQDMVCNFVYSASTTNNIIFGSMDSPNIDNSKAAVYFGTVETVQQIGFNTYDIDTILEDILFDNRPQLVNTKLITDTFKNIRSKSGKTFLPVYKYLSGLGIPLKEIPDNYNVIKSYEDISPTSNEKKKYVKHGEKFHSIKEIESFYPEHIIKQNANIKFSAENIDTEELEEYIKKYYNTDVYISNKSMFRKLIALYDYKKYSASVDKDK